MTHLEKLTAERAETVAAIHRLNEWFASTPRTDPRRPARVERYNWLTRKASELKLAIKAENRRVHDKRDHAMVVRFYNAVSELHERGVDVGPDLAALLEEFEALAEAAE